MCSIIINSSNNLAKTGTKPCLGRPRKIISVDLKKVDKIFEIFLKIRSPLRKNPRSAPGSDQALQAMKF